jgi:hypothetical protein
MVLAKIRFRLAAGRTDTRRWVCIGGLSMDQEVPLPVGMVVIMVELCRGAWRAPLLVSWATR